MNAFRIIQTADGSPSIFSEKYKAYYHSIHGALAESRHVFIKNGLAYAHKLFSGKLHVFELGFGTGLNAVLTAAYANENNFSVKYTGIDTVSLESDVLKELNYKSLIPEGELFVEKILFSDFNKQILVSDSFCIEKILNDFANYAMDDMYHVIYFDAFSPGYVPELWAKDVFLKLWNSMVQGACLVTFCSKGQFKRDLKSVGFTVQTLPGAPGKREMVRALKV